MKLFKSILVVGTLVTFVVGFAFYIGTMYDGELVWTLLILLSITTCVTLVLASIMEVKSIDDSYYNIKRRNVLWNSKMRK